jgi:uncharacterized repeat protein (TIGR01451 family)
VATQKPVRVDGVDYTQVTDLNGLYVFTDLMPGEYYVEFTAPGGYNFTHYHTTSAKEEADIEATDESLDSDAMMPWVGVSISDGGLEAELGAPFTYTFFYTNTDESRAAKNVVLSTLVPVGTTFIPGLSTMTCADGKTEAGTLCTFTLGELPAGDSGFATFTVQLADSDAEVPNELDVLVTLTQSAVARTQGISLGTGEDNMTIDAGLVRMDYNIQTPTPTESTNLPEGEQPQQPGRSIFLPALKVADPNVTASSLEQPEEVVEPQSEQQPEEVQPEELPAPEQAEQPAEGDASAQAVSLFLPNVEADQ